jgi:hypothetical protein
MYVVTRLRLDAGLYEPAPERGAAWYAKKQATFSDAIALVRRSVWRSLHFSTSASPLDAVVIPRSLFERLTDALCFAA